MTAAYQIVRRLLEDEEGDDILKDVMPSMAAAIERWVFTDYELHRPQACLRDDDFYVGVEGCELEVIV